jgi:hypothetical protein
LEERAVLKENLADSVQIIDNILKQPLSIPGHPEELSVLEAVQDFCQTKGQSSKLKEVLAMFTRYPDPTHLMLRELELISNDLEKS